MVQLHIIFLHRDLHCTIKQVPDVVCLLHAMLFQTYLVLLSKHFDLFLYIYNDQHEFFKGAISLLAAIIFLYCINLLLRRDEFCKVILHVALVALERHHQPHEA